MVFSAVLFNLLFITPVGSLHLIESPSSSTERFNKRVHIFFATSNFTEHPTVSIKTPPGWKMVGGGARVNWAGEGNLLTASYPSSENVWSAASKDHGIKSPATITVFAMGVEDPRDELLVKIFSSTGNETGHSSHSQRVPQGWMMVGGGARVNWRGKGNLLTASYPKDPMTWAAVSKDHQSNSSASISVYAIGVKNKNGTKFNVRMFNHTGHQAEHPTGSVHVPPGWKMLCGGAYVHWSEPGNLQTASYPFNGNTWMAESKDHLEYSPAHITTYAIAVQL